MMKTRIKRSRSLATRMRNVTLSCTLLVIASILVVSSCVGATDMPLATRQRQLRGKRATAALNEKDNSSRRRRTKAEKLQSPESTSNEIKKMTRIVGGAAVELPSRYPWFTRMVSLKDNGGLGACGGALIAKDLVLSAAHCGDPVQAYPGRHNLDEDGPERIDVESFQRHPEYPSLYSNDFDIMIIKMTEPSTLAEPIRLNFNDEYPVEAGESLSMLGFGSTIGGVETGQANPPVEFSRILHAAETLFVPFEQCAIARDPLTGAEYGYGLGEGETVVSPHWFCTTGPDVEESDLVTSTCYGDSGGPILKEDFFEGSVEAGATNDLLLAVISGTSGYCGNRYLPLWNQGVSYHKQWIIEVGCSLSNDPPAEWNCDTTGLKGFGVPPEDNSVYFPTVPTNDPTSAPTAKVTVAATDAPTVKATVAVTPAPTVKATVAVTPAPTIKATVAVTPAPTVKPTGVPTFKITDAPTAKMTPFTTDPPETGSKDVEEQAPTAATIEQSSSVPSNTAPPTVAPTPRPTTERPNPFLAPILNPYATDEPTRHPTRSDESSDEEEVGFVCPICENKYEIVTNPESIVFVPVLGQMTCQELFDDAAEGKIADGSTCDSVLLMASSVCSCAVATMAPTRMPSESPTMTPSSGPTAQPSGAPIGSPSTSPTNSPTTEPSATPSASPTVSPTPSPTKTPDTCEAIQIANEARDPAMMVNVTINFAFDKTEAANSIGWYLSDPDYECFRVGVASGRYSSLDVTIPLSLVGGIEYLFVLEIDGGRASGLYNVTSNNVTLAHNLLPGVMYNDEGTFFKTPRNKNSTL